MDKGDVKSNQVEISLLMALAAQERKNGESQGHHLTERLPLDGSVCTRRLPNTI